MRLVTCLCKPRSSFLGYLKISSSSDWGATHPSKVSFRLIAATNRNLKSMIRDGKFREDLYYRLNTMIIHIPPLNERNEDIPILVRHILNSLDRDEVSCSSKALDLLMSYNWPGNVRELKNAIECALSLISRDTNVIDTKDLPAAVTSSSSSVPFNRNACRSQLSTLADNQRNLIIESLEQSNWNMAKTAKLLGISRANLYEKAKKFNLSRPKAS